MQAHNSKNEQTQCMPSVFLNSDSFHFVAPLVVWEKENPSERVLELHIFFSFPSLSEKTADGMRAREVDDSNNLQVVGKKKKKRKKGKKRQRKRRNVAR